MHDEVHRCAGIVFEYLTRTRVKIRGSRDCRRSRIIISVRRVVIVVVTDARPRSREEKSLDSFNFLDLPRAERAATFFAPPKPSCRKPLSRMNKDDSSSRKTRNRYSSSPRTNPNDSCDSERYDDSDITDDDEDHESRGDEVAVESPRDRRDGSHPVFYEPEGCQLRMAPNSPWDVGPERQIPGSPDSPINLSYDSKNSQTYETTKNITRTSYSFEKTENRRRSSCEIVREETPRRGSVSKLKETRNVSIKTSCIYCIIGCAVIFVAIQWTVGSTAKSIVRRPHRLDDFRDTIKSIKDKFPRQEPDTWMDIEAGIAAVVDDSQKIAMFILFSNETRELRCLADVLGSASSRALLSENSLSLEPEDMGDEYGEAIDRWRHKIEEKKAVVVHDLLKIDPRAIQAFHTMCDRQNPLVEGAVYIMTIVTQDHVTGSQSPDKFVENQLTNKFIGKVPVDKLQPLITRLTDGAIIPVTPEVVHNLLSVDPRAIQAFHAMCDRESPLVGAVYIMTIVAQVYVAESESPDDFVENQLTNRFIDKYRSANFGR